MKTTVDALCVGQPKPFRDGELSAFAKEPVDGPVRITREGLSGDAQADRKHHGGEHMALHLYPRDHHAFWHEELGGHELLDLHGAFGSNISARGIDEGSVWLGDRFRLGSALIEISQPRMPCWKIEHRFGVPGMVKTILRTGRSGWYFRIIEEGTAQAGDALERVETGRTPWTISEIFSEIANPASPSNRERLANLARCELLSPSWRNGAEKALANRG
ncbi:MOSC domain-containing protein [Altererythrobacter sp. Z27]|uniref:MOSC domain-containing protein n=1 Tax=Altererythrobacter sp. Z27 TaxID=3461147 RepID=UPI00404500B1